MLTPLRNKRPKARPRPVPVFIAVKDGELHTALVQAGHPDILDGAEPDEQVPEIVPVSIPSALAALFIAPGPDPVGDLLGQQACNESLINFFTPKAILAQTTSWRFSMTSSTMSSCESRLAFRGCYLLPWFVPNFK